MKKENNINIDFKLFIEMMDESDKIKYINMFDLIINSPMSSEKVKTTSNSIKKMIYNKKYNDKSITNALDLLITVMQPEDKLKYTRIINQLKTNKNMSLNLIDLMSSIEDKLTLTEEEKKKIKK